MPGRNNRNRRYRLRSSNLGEKAANVLEEQKKPMQQVSEDEQGRKLTVIMGGETQMDQLWIQLKMAQALRNQVINVIKQIKKFRVEFAAPVKIKNREQVEAEIEQVENNLSGLRARIRGAIRKNNKAAVAEHGIRVMDLFYFTPIADDEQAATGFEEELSEASDMVKDLQQRIKADVYVFYSVHLWAVYVLPGFFDPPLDAGSRLLRQLVTFAPLGGVDGSLGMIIDSS
ncbi:hypothetical protein CSUB01_07029 [Colletotrichum sublineola]|uniref:Uncharacterized protein n=1 Tax=Colletotrichum sublineola TaxID=1173701 RepID=A0A066X5I8_COLSU|nr:hypothetical protein CSUB01_07029 [Colletotrichum sublineola]